MGKYMKAKRRGDLALMDLTALTVRTRAKTLALQRQAASCGYHLRSRRHLRPLPPLLIHDFKMQKHNKPKPNPRSSSKNARQDNRNGSNGKRGGARIRDVSGSGSCIGMNKDDEKKVGEVGEVKDSGLQASLGENTLACKSREMSTRESTPCSLTREPEAIPTPGFSTRSTSSTVGNQILQVRRRIPTAQEMDEFFAKVEKKKLQEFADKYNFDPVSDKPLPGRYKWEKVDEDP